MVKSSTMFFKLFLTLLRMSTKKLEGTMPKAETCIWRTGRIKRGVCSCLSEEHSHSVTLSLPPCLSLQIPANPPLLIHIDPYNSFLFSVFDSHCSSCQTFLLFSLIIYSSLSFSLLFLLSLSMGIWMWAKQWL